MIPKYLFGRPLDQYAASPKIPFAVRRRVMERLLRAQVGDMERYGLPKPDHRFGDAHPTISDDVAVADRPRRDPAKPEHRSG